MNKDKSSKATTKRLVASGIMLFGGFLTFVNKPQDVHAEDGIAPVKETNTTATESSNVAVLKSSVKSTSESGSKVATSGEESAVKQVSADELSAVTAVAAEPATVAETSEATSSRVLAATPAPATGSVDSKETQILSKTITIDGKKYIYKGEANTGTNPLFKNQVISASDGTVYTYSGNGGTSSYHMRITGNVYKPLIADMTAITTGKDANSISKSLPIINENVKIKESLSFTNDGQIVHTVTVTNTGTEAMNDVSFGVALDTVLGTDDFTDIFASGTGGAFFKNKDITVYTTGLENTDVYAGMWGDTRDIYNRVPATGTYGQNLIQGADSAIQYETGKINLAPGASYTFKFAERFQFKNQDQGKLTVRYVDSTGKTLRPNQILENSVGQNSKITPTTIKGYTFQSSSMPLTGKYTKADQTVTLVYRDNKLPATQEQTTPTPKQKTSAPAVTIKSNNVLPQTGEKSASTVSVIGVGLLATLSLFGLAKLRRRENN